MTRLDKQKYIHILKTQGYPAAITALHHDKEICEIETFEGPEGYQRALWDDLEEFREFSRELWDMATAEEGNPNQE